MKIKDMKSFAWALIWFSLFQNMIWAPTKDLTPYRALIDFILIIFFGAFFIQKLEDAFK